MSAQPNTNFAADSQFFDAAEYIVRVLECGTVVYEEVDALILDI